MIIPIISLEGFVRAMDPRPQTAGEKLDAELKKQRREIQELRDEMKRAEDRARIRRILGLQ